MCQDKFHYTSKSGPNANCPLSFQGLDLHHKTETSLGYRIGNQKSLVASNPLVPNGGLDSLVKISKTGRKRTAEIPS